MLEVACQGLSIKPEQLRQELEAGGDIPYLVSGVLTPAALRLTAETLSNMRYGGEALKSNTPADASHRAVQQLSYNVLSATAQRQDTDTLQSSQHAAPSDVDCLALAGSRCRPKPGRDASKPALGAGLV
jgi:hypothetical protein